MTDKLDAAKLLEGTTPGPWSEDAIAICGGGQDICYMGELAQWSGDGAHPLPNADANARLIAAVPDLARENIALREAMGRIHQLALAGEGVGYDLILSVTEPFTTEKG
jgi:hypothetical protein